MNNPTNDAPVVMPACAGIDFGKERLNRRPGFVTKHILVGHVRSVHPANLGWLASENPSDSYALIEF
jgi:hypothetical protein